MKIVPPLLAALLVSAALTAPADAATRDPGDTAAERLGWGTPLAGSCRER
jgi:hypothetical protein